ncbi:MAG TPA: aminopeptidase, partial [Gaiellaceae bacterium]|nr:aminopeptidase [Gaiellaceae bacterium]
MSERLRRFADVVVGYCAGVERGDLVVLQGTMNVEPLIEQLYAAVLRAGGNPANRVMPELSDLLMSDGSDEQIQWLTPGEREDIEQADVWIVVEAPSNTKELTGVDPERQALRQRARSP